MSDTSGAGLNLLEKYRPRRLSDIRFQDAACELFRATLGRGIGGNFLLTGQTGVGKSTFAELAGRAHVCDDRLADGSACGSCSTCRAIERQQAVDTFAFINVPNQGLVHNMSEVLANLSRGRSSSTVLDEIQHMSQKALDLFLPETNVVRPWAAIIATTTEVEKLPQTFQQRFTRVHLPTPTVVELATYAGEVLTEEGVMFDQLALSPLAAAAHGSVRGLLQLLNSLLRDAPQQVTAERVFSLLRQLSLLPAKQLLLDIVMAERPAGLLTRLADYAPEATRKEVEALMATVLSVMGSTSIADADPDLAVVLRATRRAAQLCGQSPVQVIEDLIETWAARPTPLSAPQLAMKVSKTIRVIGGAARLPDLAPASPGNPERVRTGRLRIASPGRYLTLHQIRTCLRAASAVTQLMGRTFDLKVELRHEDARAAARTVSEVTHGFASFFRERGVVQPAWMYVHRRRGEHPTTLLLLAVDRQDLPVATEWLERVIKGRPGLAGCSLDTCRHDAEPDRLAHQAEVLRDLCSALDPAIVATDAIGARRPLADILEIPHARRAPLGDAFTNVTIQVSPATRAELVRRSVGNGLSPLDPIADGAWNAVLAGWELGEWRDRQAWRAFGGNDMPALRDRARSWRTWW